MDDKRASMVALCLLALVGCSSTGAGRFGTTSVTTQSAQKGGTTRVFASGKNLREHVRSAMEDVGISQINQVQRLDGTNFEGKSASGKRATVILGEQGSQSLVSTRFGLLGDESLTLAFFDRLELLEKSKGKAPKDEEIQQADAEDEERPKRTKRLARDAVSDDVMMKNQAEVGYRDSPIP